ncbi:Na(+)-translocating NADH-quinone reductase subunit A [Engelhardtia mirabilis]|uniref:Na(+)-translocating NADH-quinone reductase subunit A n=1 Tax=Engelhardtia mirabilis TaxID=2528011 RepID=A0A518BKP2_9BACT|nr:Na(+)-translocating NADH-quinone reductase subunit A [Planctomycetes bacterium Pla133]QDV01839.1 Na(+)-translocating NADH-quinone reductase subunit A [Planctomycetes bacterium Pla86]
MPPITIKRGLDVPIDGRAATSTISDRLDVGQVALLPQQARGIKTKLLVEEGQTVQVGQPLFHDRRDEAVLFTAPSAGKVRAIHRGARRLPLSVVIDVEGSGQIDLDAPKPGSASPEQLKAALQTSGLWANLRRRPYDTIARTDDSPVGIVVTAMDTRPLAPRPLDALAGREDAFRAGLAVLVALQSGAVFLCVAPGENWGALTAEGVRTETFAGPHPAGNAGTHIHHLCPVGGGRVAWHIGYQAVADIGQFFTSGKLSTTRVVAITGPMAREPRLIRTRQGAALAALSAGEGAQDEVRVVDGSALDGRHLELAGPQGYLGRYGNQLTLLDDAVRRQLLGWMMPVAGRYSLTNLLLDKFFRKRFRMDTDSNGSLRAIVPIGVYERVMPLDILATQLIKALASHDMEGAEKLGALELAEEDLALCEYVDPCKLPVTEMLRDMLTRIEKEG